MKTRDAVEGFHLLENSHRLCQGFQQAMEAWTTCFSSFIKLFSLLTKRKTVCEEHIVDQSKCTYYPNYFINNNLFLLCFSDNNWWHCVPGVCYFTILPQRLIYNYKKS